jgi:signal transduction histidine kinase
MRAGFISCHCDSRLRAMVTAPNDTAQQRPWLLQSKLRLFATLFLVLALPTGVLTALVATHVRNHIKTQAIHQNSLMAKIVARNVDEQFYRLRKEVQEFANRSKLIEFASEGDAEAIRGKLAEFLRISPVFSRAFVADKEGRLVTDLPFSKEIVGQDFSQRDWFKGTSKRKDSYVSEIYQRTMDAAKVITVCCQIRDAKDNTVGFLCGQLTTDRLVMWMDELKPATEGSVVLLDQASHRVTKNNAHPDTNQTVILEHSTGKADQHFFARDKKGEEFLISSARVTSIGWTAVALQPTDKMFSPLRTLLQTITIFFILCVFVMGIVGYYWFKTITKFEEHRERADEELRTYALNLKRSNDELEGLCYSIAHDLRAPLRALRGFAFALSDEYDATLDHAGRDYTKRISDSARRMDELTQDLLDYGRLGHLDMPVEDIDLNLVLKKVLAEMSQQIQNQHACLDVKQLPKVRGNDSILQQVFSNLVSNALKFVKPGCAPRIKIWAEESENTVTLKIQDNGIGIDPTHHSKIFGVFERLHHHDVYPGTGIGLAIVRKAIERLGGRVGVESKRGEGSCFWFELRKSGSFPKTAGMG